jgi:hypothetical protein
VRGAIAASRLLPSSGLSANFPAQRPCAWERPSQEGRDGEPFLNIRTTTNWRLHPASPSPAVGDQGFRLVHFWVLRVDLSDPDACESTSFVESVFKRPGRFPMRRSPNLNQAKALSSPPVASSRPPR